MLCILQKNGHRIYVSKYKMFVYFCILLISLMNRFVLHSVIQTDTIDFMSTLYHLKELTWLHASKLLYRPICLSLSHYLGQSVNNDFCPPYIFQNDVYRTCFAKYKLFVWSCYINFMCLTSLWSNSFHFKFKASLLWTVCPCFIENGIFLSL